MSLSQTLRLIPLALRSGAVRRGRRRRNHPFVTAFEPGQVIPHQGGHWPGVAPNTLEAFRHAAPRTQVLDVDVWLTNDGVPVCAHDDELESGARITESAWAELAGAGIPRLEDVATEFAGHLLNIELKHGAALVPVRDVMRDHDLAERSCLSAFSPLLARAMAGAVPDAAHARPTAKRIGRIWGSGDVVQTMTFVPDALPVLGPLKPLVLRLLFRAGSPELVIDQLAGAAAKGLPVYAWTVNEADPLRRLIDAGVDAVLSDDPELFDPPRSDG